MTIDVSLIPQNRVENLISKLSEIENNIGNIGTDITNNVVHRSGNETINGNKTFSQQPRYSGTTAASSAQDSTALATVGYLNNPNLSLNVVHKTGDETITGTKTYNIDGYDIYKSTVMDITNKPSESHSIGTNYSDKNGYVHGQIFLSTESNGSVIQSITCQNHSRTSWASFSVGFDSSDNKFAFLNGNNIKGFVKETWQSGTSWYRVWSDGWIEQGGYTPRISDAFISVNFAKPFSQDNPNVQLTRRFYYDNDSTSCQNRTTGVSSVTKTGFKCHDNGWPANGGSAGVWYACGY